MPGSEMTSEATAGAAGQLARDLVSLLLVLALAAALLRGLDVLPQELGEPAGGRPFGSIAEVERRLGERLARPAYFPESLAWPPARLRVGGQRPATVVMGFTARSGGAERLLLGQTIGGAAEMPARLWSPGWVLEAAEVRLATGAPLDAERPPEPPADNGEPMSFPLAGPLFGLPPSSTAPDPSSVAPAPGPAPSGSPVATLSRLRGDDGAIWLELRWEQWGRRLAMRSAGPREELFAMARSMRREGP
jgi:hypothetical protein